MNVSVASRVYKVKSTVYFNISLATCDTSQVLLAGVPGGFSRGSPAFALPTDWPVSYELK